MASTQLEQPGKDSSWSAHFNEVKICDQVLQSADFEVKAQCERDLCDRARDIKYADEVRRG